jgi:hypothetical protein
MRCAVYVHAEEEGMHKEYWLRNLNVRNEPRCLRVHKKAISRASIQKKGVSTK